MQAYAQYLPDKMKNEREMCVVRVCRYASSAAEQQLFLRHLPRSRHSVSSHCQPLQPTALTSISHFIMSHHNSRRLAGSALLGVARRFLALLAGLAGLAGLAVLAATTCSHPQLPVGAGGEAMG